MSSIRKSLVEDVQVEFPYEIVECIGHGLSDLLIACDNDFIIQYTNIKVQEKLGYSKKQLIGMHVNDLIFGSKPKGHLIIGSLAYAELPYEFEIDISHKRKNSCAPYAITLSRITQHHDAGYILIAKDISQVKRATRALEDKNAELETLIYRISHDLKGPLASMKGLLELIELEGGENDVAENLNYLQLVKKSSQKLEDTLVGLLQLGLAKKENIVYEEINLKEWIKEVISGFDNFPGRGQVIIHLTANEDLTLKTEPKMFTSVIQNLIENSIKYRKVNTNDSVTKVSVRKYKKGIKIKVKDNGMGMDNDMQKRVFDMFYRGHQHTEGTGLGMFIVKTHVEKLGGTISISSTPQVSTEVTLFFENQNNKASI
jgi:PAS domain S-box-containing protein